MLREQEMIDTMKEALSEHQFQVYLQPKYDIRSERLAGAEALVRWNHPKLGMVKTGGIYSAVRTQWVYCGAGQAMCGIEPAKSWSNGLSPRKSMCDFRQTFPQGHLSGKPARHTDRGL
jgi:hypothetical protein